jgi:urate oxidase
MMVTPLSLSTLNNGNQQRFVEALGALFEHSPWVAAEAWHKRPFANTDELHQALCHAMYDASIDRQLALLLAHPDLAGKAAVAHELTAASTSEQAGVGLDRLSPDEFARFTELNQAYRDRFGFPFIICVREHTKHSILANFAARLDHTRDEEITTALGEIAKIANLRLRDLVAPHEAQSAIATPMTEPTERAASDAIMLGHTNYGKSEVRLVKVTHHKERHDIHDLNVAVTLEGDFAACFMDGDNTDIMATDTMRNTVYALGKKHPLDTIESFGMALVDQYLQAGPRTSRATVHIIEYPWQRITVNGQPHPIAFTRDAGERVATVTGDKNGERQIEAGIDNLLILKTTDSGWEHFLQAEYTTLPDARDRILATVVTANWQYNSTDLDFNAVWNGVRQQILVTFTDHYSPSMQNTLYRMGKAVLEAFPMVEKIHFSFPNKHHLLYDLKRFGMENHNEIFQATNEPYGLIEGTVERRSQ